MVAKRRSQSAMRRVRKIREVITGDGEPRLDNGQLRRVLSDSIFRKYHDEQFVLKLDGTVERCMKRYRTQKLLTGIHY